MGVGGLWSKFKFFFLGLFLAGLRPCIAHTRRCNRTIALFGDYECSYVFQDQFESVIRVYGNSSVTNSQVDFDGGSRPRNTCTRTTPLGSVRLVAYPIFLRKPNFLYKARLCIEISSEDLLTSQFVRLLFSARNDSEGGHVYRAEGSHRIVSLNADDSKRYISVGCYWHFHFLSATFARTVQLELVLTGKGGDESCAKFYFRLPYWEQFNDHKDVDPCSFEPFIYVQETGKTEDDIFITVVNCSRAAVVEVQQREQPTGVVLRSELVHISYEKVNHASFPGSKLLHFYRASMNETKDDSSFEEVALIPIIAVSAVSIALVVWCLTRLLLAPRNAILMLKEKPKVKFEYCKRRAFDIYMKQAEIFILFLEKYCNVAVVDRSRESHETPETSLLSEELFDAIVWIPFPATFGNSSDDDSTSCPVKRYEGLKKDRIMVELPFWSRSRAPFEDLSKSNEEWKQFKLMDEFVKFVRYLNRSHHWWEKRFRSAVRIEHINQKLEEYNLTNEGFLFCLEGTCPDENIFEAESYPEARPMTYPNLQDMAM